jgi:hypothetical protein
MSSISIVLLVSEVLKYLLILFLVLIVSHGLVHPELQLIHVIFINRYGLHLLILLFLFVCRSLVILDYVLLHFYY